MTQQEIIEGNKLIAVFMGMEIIDEFKLRYGQEWHETIDRGKLIYRSDWNDLMSVVEKINSIECCSVDIGKQDTLIRYFGDKNYHEPLSIESGQSKIENVWLAVVAFIKWYNKTIPSPAKEEAL